MFDAKTQCSLTAISVNDATNCPGQPGVLGQIQVFPDNPSYNYTLIGGGVVYGPQPSNTFTNLAGGVVYFLSVDFGTGCVVDTVVSVGLGVNAVTATWNTGALQNMSCFGNLDGAAAITNVGGGISPPYVVTWTNTAGLFDNTTVGVGGSDAITNLFVGDWVVTVKDQEGCAWSHLFEILEPDELIITANTNDPTCYLFTDGSIDLVTTGGNGGNSFTITNISGTQLNFGGSANNLPSGWYYFSVQDMEGCIASDSIFIYQPGELDIDLSLDVPLCHDDGMAIVDTVYNYNGAYGNIAYFWNPNPSGTNGIGATTCSNLYDGNYTLTVNDENGCSKVFDFTTTSPPELVFSTLMVTHYSTSMSGVVSASASGGTPSYSYLWTNLGTLVTSTNTTWGGLLPGDYQIEVTDGNGCILTAIVSIGYLSIDDNNLAEPLQVYPTLLNGANLNVSNQNQSPSSLSIFDLQGKKVFNEELIFGDNTLYLNLAEGTYVYQVVDASGILQEGKIVVVE